MDQSIQVKLPKLEVFKIHKENTGVLLISFSYSSSYYLILSLTTFSTIDDYVVLVLYIFIVFPQFIILLIQQELLSTY